MFQRPAQARPCAAHRACSPPPAGAQGLRLPAAQREPLLARTLLVINTPTPMAVTRPRAALIAAA